MENLFIHMPNIRHNLEKTNPRKFNKNSSKILNFYLPLVHSSFICGKKWCLQNICKTLMEIEIKYGLVNRADFLIKLGVPPTKYEYVYQVNIWLSLQAFTRKYVNFSTEALKHTFYSSEFFMRFIPFIFHVTKNSNKSNFSYFSL